MLIQVSLNYTYFLLLQHICFLFSSKIDVDFRLMYGIDDGVKKWNLAFPKLVKYLDRPYKDDFSKKILECLKSPESDLGK